MHEADVRMLLLVQTGLTSMGLEIGNFNKDDFAPIGATVGNFPGFELGQMYRLYIEYYDSEGVQLNAGHELSEFAAPMIKASPPLVCYAEKASPFMFSCKISFQTRC